MGAVPSPATEEKTEDANLASKRVVRRPLPMTEVARSTVSCGALDSDSHCDRNRYSADSPRALDKE